MLSLFWLFQSAAEAYIYVDEQLFLRCHGREALLEVQGTD